MVPLFPNDRRGPLGINPRGAVLPHPRLPNEPKYSTYRKDVSVPPDVLGAHVGFRKGKGYYIADGTAARPRTGTAGTPRAGAAPSAPANPYAGLGPYGSDYAQASGIAKAQIDPLVAALASQIQRQTTAGIGAITGYTGQLAQSLGGQQQRAAGIWGAAQQAQAASDAALSNRLTAGGTELAGQLSDRLASINAPAATGQAAANVAQTGAGAGNAAYGTGSAELGSLISQGAAAQDYASKLPGLAQLGGVQGVRDFGLSQQKNLADQSQQLLSQAPGLQNTALQYISGRKDAAAAATASARDAKTKELQQRFENAVALGYDPATGKLTVKAQNDIKRIQLEAQRVGISQASLDQRGAAASATAARTAGTVNPTLSAAYGVQVNNQGELIPGPGGKPIPYKPYVAPGTVKPEGSTLTAGQKATIRQNAVKTADFYYFGKDPNASGVGGISGIKYPDALHRMMAAYPSLTQRDVQDILADYYAPGERGRPMHDVNPRTNPNAAGPPAPRR